GGRRLSGAGLGVAGEAGFGVAHDEIDGHRQFDADRLALVGGSVQPHPVLEVVDGVTELGRRQAELVIRVGVHEMEVAAVAVEELDRAPFHRSARPFGSGLEGPLDRLAALDVAQRDADLGRAAAHLDVVVVEDLPEVAVELDGDALAQFAGADHVGWGILGRMASRATRRVPAYRPTTTTSRGKRVRRSTRRAAASSAIRSSIRTPISPSR